MSALTRTCVQHPLDLECSSAIVVPKTIHGNAKDLSLWGGGSESTKEAK